MFLTILEREVAVGKTFTGLNFFLKQFHRNHVLTLNILQFVHCTIQFFGVFLCSFGFLIACF
jgi:hypothetical protein